ncbi:MAG: biotin--[acetyl-CoA-carboxylase] ligase [Saprospiraceae bacterium]
MDFEINTLFIGKVLLEYDRLDSTNMEAERLFRKQKPTEGIILLAHEQFAGRGQMGNQWLTQAKMNLTFSLVLTPVFLQFPAEHFLLNEVVVLAIKDALDDMGLGNVKVKWPNDVMVDDKKIAGILIQNTIAGKGMKHSVIGIGLNVNQMEFPDGANKATSMKKVLGKEIPLNKMLNLLCQRIEYYYLKLKRGNIAFLEEEYHNSLYKMGEKSMYERADGSSFLGEIKGVKRMGFLQVENEKNEIESFQFKEIKFL